MVRTPTLTECIVMRAPPFSRAGNTAKAEVASLQLPPLSPPPEDLFLALSGHSRRRQVSFEPKVDSCEY